MIQVNKTRVKTSGGPDIEIWDVVTYKSDDMDDIYQDAVEASDRTNSMILLIWASHSPEEYLWFHEGQEIFSYNREE